MYLLITFLALFIALVQTALESVPTEEENDETETLFLIGAFSENEGTNGE